MRTYAEPLYAKNGLTGHPMPTECEHELYAVALCSLFVHKPLSYSEPCREGLRYRLVGSKGCRSPVRVAVKILLSTCF